MSDRETQNSPLEKFKLYQLWNMNCGFLGIQFAWGLQMANMSAIFEDLGANAYQIPFLWIAAPLTGLIVQPIIGNLSDYTWGPLGRRRPYILIGGILAFIGLILMPSCSKLWIAAGLLWLLDTSVNVSMVPFRAFVGDLLPKEQRTLGFAMQSLMVGIGAVSASALPWILNHIFSVANSSNQTSKIPQNVELSFYIGAAVFLVTVLWTVITTKEKPPKNLEKFKQLQEQRGGILASVKEIWLSLQKMPQTMQQLGWVQFFTWLGIFCFFLYFPPAVARNIFGAVSQDSSLYSEGIEWAGLCCALYNGICVGFSFLLPYLAKRTSHQITHSFCLLWGGLSLISLLVIQNQYVLLLVMIGFGIAWSSTLTMPYAILVRSIPAQRQGIYQGIFNLFIVLPQISVSLGFGWVMRNLLHEDRALAVVLGGVFLIVAAGLTMLVKIAPTVVESKSSDQTVSEITSKDSKEVALKLEAKIEN